jgi:hypothetical protein
MNTKKKHLNTDEKKQTQNIEFSDGQPFFRKKHDGAKK